MNDRKIAMLEKNFNLYWAGEEPEISDERFDQLLKELRQEHPDHPLLDKLGLSVARGIEYRHDQPMLSLDKVYSWKDLLKWVSKVSRNQDEKFFVQYKFDGLAGKLSGTTLATRGDGTIGENISRQKINIDLIRGKKREQLVKINAEEPIIGEIVVTFENFKIYQDLMERSFAHPRNFVAGMINRKEPIPQAVRLDFVSYKESKTIEIDRKNFNEENWNKIVAEMEKDKQYPTDGLVIKLADNEYADSLGYTSHHPLGSLAFKFYGNRAWTTLINIEWSHGKDCLTPVGIVSPVNIGGVTIQRVTLHNAKFVQHRDIRIGDQLEIERAGEVIPHVLNRKPGEKRKSSIPNNCPTCQESLIYEGVEIKCPNPECPGTKLEKIRCALEFFEIDGLGDTIIQHLFSTGKLKTAADIFKLSFEDAIRIPGFADGAANKLIAAINRSRSMTEQTILASLNTPGVGKGIYAKILEQIPFSQLVDGVSSQRLATLPNIGESRAIAIVKSIKRNKEYLHNLLSIVDLKKQEQREGKKICFTGKMPESRSYYVKAAKDRGFIAVDSVSKDLDLLVISSADWTSSKTKSAVKYGIKIITLQEWENEK